MILKKLLAEPLLHFFLLGALLFVIYGWLNTEEAGAQEEIIITTSMLDQMEETFQRAWQRPPTAQELDGLIEGRVREEILYRQGVAVGFDQDDPVIRRRVAQKMTFVADGLVPETPTDEQLKTWLEKNPEQYGLPPRFTFAQVYINPEKHVADLDEVLADTFAALRGPAVTRDDAVDDRRPVGDSIMLPGEVALAAPREIERIFGLEFAAAIAQLEVGSWQGPVVSGYGLHFVRLQDMVPGRAATLDDVRDEVQRDFLDDQAAQISESFYEAIRERYTVRVAQRDSGN